jgi:hypothetical protein
MERVINNAHAYLGKNSVILPSTRKDKKFMVIKPNGSWVHFGQKGYDDFTQHGNKKRQQRYLKRSAGIKGDWKNDKYSSNNLSREILWR